jgi:hypothetical protein
MTEDDEPSSGRRPGLARPYAWTDGRTEPSAEIAIEAQVQATPASQRAVLSPTSPQWMVLARCVEPVGVAEIAALLSLPLGVVKVLVADLLGADLVTVHATLDDDTDTDERRELIERVLSGLRAQ